MEMGAAGRSSPTCCLCSFFLVAQAYYPASAWKSEDSVSFAGRIARSSPHNCPSSNGCGHSMVCHCRYSVLAYTACCIPAAIWWRCSWSEDQEEVSGHWAKPFVSKALQWWYEQTVVQPLEEHAYSERALEHFPLLVFVLLQYSLSP